MKTFKFYAKNSSAVVILSAPNFDMAEKELFETVISQYGWRVENEEGEDEDMGEELPKHCCGAHGFNPMLGDECPACNV